MLYNYHTHTARCNHAAGRDEEYVESAIAAGIKTLGFSDHAPYLFKNTDYYSTFRMRVDELHAYAESVRSLAKKYQQDIRILLGFELEYYPDLFQDEIAFLQGENPDYLLLGQHFVGNEIGETYSGAANKGDEFLPRYVTQVLEGLKTGKFLYLAHPDLPGCKFSPDVVQTEYRRLCEGAKRLGIPLEVNLLGLREGRVYPDETFFKIAAEVGNEIVIGVDAHHPDNLLDKDTENKALTLCARLGLNVRQIPLL